MKVEKAINITKTNVVDHCQNSKGKQRDKVKGVKLGSIGEISKKPKTQPPKGFQGLYFNCGKTSYKSNFCKFPKRKQETNTLGDIF